MTESKTSRTKDPVDKSLTSAQQFDHYSSIAHAAHLAGESEIAQNYEKYARDLAFMDSEAKEALKKKRVRETITAIQILTAYGEEEIVRQRPNDPSLLWGDHINNHSGVMLYSGADNIAEDVLDQVYAQLGVAQQRNYAVPTGTTDEHIFERRMKTPWGIILTEEQITYPEEEDLKAIYTLYGQRTTQAD